jgi:hypothetical protein
MTQGRRTGDMRGVEKERKGEEKEWGGGGRKDAEFCQHTASILTNAQYYIVLTSFIGYDIVWTISHWIIITNLQYWQYSIR